MDWNWFFSSAAQCAAAIVGFLGGFVISKVISREAAVSRLHSDISRTQDRISDQRRRLSSRHFDWLNVQMRETVVESEDFNTLVRNGTATPDYDALIEELAFSPYDKRDEMVATIDSFWGKQRKTLSPGMMPAFPQPQNLMIYRYSSIYDEQEKIRLEINNTYRLIDDLHNLISESESLERGKASTAVILILNYLLFLAGVVLPLSIMPTAADSPSFTPFRVSAFQIPTSWKAMILIAIFLIFTALVLVFIIINARLRIAKNEIVQLRQCLSLSSFCAKLGDFESRSLSRG